MFIRIFFFNKQFIDKIIDGLPSSKSSIELIKKLHEIPLIISNRITDGINI